MGKKEVVFYKNRYKGNKLSEEDCEKLENIIQLSDKNMPVKDLKNIIYDLTYSEVESVINNQGTDYLEEVRTGELSDSQTTGVAFMYYAKRAILGDSVGMGKTVQVCGLCNLLESINYKKGTDFRFLLLTEKTLIPDTRRKMIQFTGNYVECLYGEKDNIKKFEKKYSGNIPPNIVGAHSLLTSPYFQDYIRGFIEEYWYNPFDILLIDESGDILINSTTKTYKASLYFERIFKRIVLMNATSFEKELDHFYNQLNFLDNSLLPTKEEFSKKYKEFTYGVMPYPVFKKYKNGEDFKKLVGYRYFSRTRKSTGAKMEGCTADVYVSDLSKVQKSLLGQVSLPNMVYDCPSYFSNYIQGLETNVETTPKMQDLLDIITGVVPKDDSVLVFSRYKEAQRCIKDLLDSYGIESYVLNGESSADERDYLCNKFKLGDFKVLITNVQKGLDFGNCNYCIFYDYDPSPSKMVQFEGRMTREHDIINKHVYVILSMGAELRSFKNLVADRAKASDVFAGSDFSCIMSLLLNEDIKNLK